MKLHAWRIKDVAHGAGRPDAILAEAGWLDVNLPTDTYLALHAAGRLPHPFADGNEEACRWVVEREWWWHAVFQAPLISADERLRLEFGGLDTFATIWLNGVLLGQTDNMFRAYGYDVTDLMRIEGRNEILIRFTPPSVMVADKSVLAWNISSAPIKISKRNHMRKAQFGWGWDWAPHLPTVGVWRPVTIEARPRTTIDTIRFSTLSISDGALTRVEVDLTGEHRDDLELVMTLKTPDGIVAASATMASRDELAAVELLVERPELWWTADLGGQPLYELEVQLRQDGAIRDRRIQKVGLRTIVLDTGPDRDEPGASFFRFVLNGVPIFARGANWIPASSFVGALDRADYAPLIETAIAANMNMLRVWGGGIYEHDAFYDLCDERGLLVWQDFMFACAPYPENDPDLVATIQAEIDFQIRRLHNHPCLSLWCGNNEGQAIHHMVTRLQGRSDPYPGELYFESIIPQAVERLDPTTPYWPGSPSGGPSYNSMKAGDVHNWTVWHGFPQIPDATPVGNFDPSPEGVAYTRYAEDMARFVSEFGIQAAPALQTLERWLSPDQLVLGSEHFLSRIKDHPKDKVNAMLANVTGLPSTLRQYVDFTQFVQAEGLKFGIEHYRRRKPHCSGTLIWQLNDCWPGISWSLVDHDGARKPSWYTVARAYAPVAASFRRTEDGAVEFWVINDTGEEANIDAELVLTCLTGETCWRETVAAKAPAHGVILLRTLAPDRFTPFGEASLSARSTIFPTNHLLLADAGPLLGSAEPLLSLRKLAEGEWEAKLTGTAYHLMVVIETHRPDVVFSDNAFSLERDEVRKLILTTNGPVTDDDIHIRTI
jgi:beta-mannosidase